MTTTPPMEDHRPLYSPILRTYGPHHLYEHSDGPRPIKVNGRDYLALSCALPPGQQAFVAGFTERDPITRLLVPVCSTGMPNATTAFWELRWPNDDGPSDPPTPIPTPPNLQKKPTSLGLFWNPETEFIAPSHHKPFDGIVIIIDDPADGELFDPP